jgi:hypothetical protein
MAFLSELRACNTHASSALLAFYSASSYTEKSMSGFSLDLDADAARTIALSAKNSLSFECRVE